MFVENTRTSAQIISQIGDFAYRCGFSFESLAPQVGKAFLAYVEDLSKGELPRMDTADLSGFEVGVYDTLDLNNFVKQWSGEDIGNVNLSRDELEVLEMCKSLVDVPALRDISNQEPPNIIWGGSLIRLLMRLPYYEYNYGEKVVA